MYHFEYVTKAEAAPVKKELIAIINAVQDLLRDHFTFRFDFIGSSARNMITQDVKSNIIDCKRIQKKTLIVNQSGAFLAKFDLR